jgi:hypothetical protein
MFDQNDTSYRQRREREELALAKTANCNEARIAHLGMAARYAQATADHPDLILEESKMV